MNAVRPLYDTLAYAKKLKEAGFTDRQAEVQAEALLSFFQEGLATKADLHDVETSLRSEMRDLETRIDARFNEVDRRFNEIDSRFNEMEGRFKEIDGRFSEIRLEIRATNAETKAELVRWVVGVGMLQIALITALLLKMLPG
jgi:chromosome segregation ATPase